MGVSVYPVLNRNVPGFDATEVSGRCLAAAIFEPNSAFAVLERFSNMNEDELRELIVGQTGQDPNEITVPAEEWFSPAYGLTVVRALLVQTMTPPVRWEAEEFTEWLANDLQVLEKTLLLAQEHGALFHLTMDF